jgi:RHS repeat-associated protein
MSLRIPSIAALCAGLLLCSARPAAAAITSCDGHGAIGLRFVTGPTADGFCRDALGQLTDVPNFMHRVYVFRCSDLQPMVSGLGAYWLSATGWKPTSCGQPEHETFGGMNAAGSTCLAKCEPKPEASSCQDPAATTPQRAAGNKAGDPVDLTTGFLEYTVTDADLGRGLRFTRHYNSGDVVGASGRLTAMGTSWAHSLDWELVRPDDGETSLDLPMVLVRPPLGTPQVFATWVGESAWSAGLGARGSLRTAPGGGLVYTDANGLEAEFDAANQLVALRPPGEPEIAVSVSGNVTTYSNSLSTLVVTHNAGRVQSVSADGVVTSYSYDGSSRLTGVTTPDPGAPGQSITWTYVYGGGEPWLLTQVKRTARSQPIETLATWSYWPNTNKVKTASEPALDQDLLLTFGSQTTVTDINSQTIATLSTEDGMIFSATGSGGPGFPIPWASATTEDLDGKHRDRWLTRTDANGHKTRFESHDARGRPGRIVDGWVDMDASGGFSAGDKYADRTEYLWHPRLDRPLEVLRESALTGVLEAVTVFDYDDPAAPGDDPFDPNEEPTDRVYARIEMGQTLDEAGAVIERTATTFFRYNAAGKLETVDGPREGQSFTRHHYDANGHRDWTRRYLAGDGSAYLQTSFGSFDARGNPETVTDPNGRVTTFTYDAASRVKTVTPPFSGGGSTLTFHYDVDGRIEKIDFPADSAGVPYFLRFGYNAKGALLFVADAKNDAIVYQYGGRNKRIRASLHRGFVDYGNRGTLVGDAKFQYAALSGELYKAFNPLFGDPSPVYSEFGQDAKGNTTSVVDENGKQDTLLYDALDRLKKVQQVRTASYSTWFQRQPEIGLPLPVDVDLRVIDPAGKQTDYVNDDFGRLVKVISPDTGTTLFNYDEAGNLIRKIEAFGTGAQRETNYTYDGLDRLLTIDLPTNADWTFTYDTDAAKNQKGRLAKATNGIVTTDLEYTARGQLAKESTTYNARRYDVTYTFDAAGNVATIQTPSGTVMTYRYAGSRVSEVDVTKGTRTETIRGLEWLPFGPLDEAKLPPYDGANNVVTLDRSYNLRYQLTDLLVTGPGGAIVDRDYSYTNTASPGPNDPGPNLDKLVDNLDASESRFYFYDDLDRLSRATDLTGANLFEYGHDPAGNRTFKTDAFGTTAYSYETGTDRLATATGAEQAFYANDAYGNRIYSGSTPYAGTPTHTYNEQNRLVSTVTPQGTVNAVYEAFGRRVAWQTLRFVYDPSGRILEVSNRSSGLWWGDLVWVEGELLGRVESTGAVGVPAALPPAIARHLPRDPTAWLLVAGATGSLFLVVLAARRRSPRMAWAGAGSAALTLLGLACVPTGLEFYWVVTDQIGFPIAMTNTPAVPGDAEVIWRASYEPFGLATEELDPDGDGKQVRMPLRFPGQWWDYAANTHDNGFRTYDPATGRYLEPDPIGQAGGVNRFLYAGNSPLNLVDTNGTNPLAVGLLLAGGSIAAGGIVGGTVAAGVGSTARRAALQATLLSNLVGSGATFVGLAAELAPVAATSFLRSVPGLPASIAQRLPLAPAINQKRDELLDALNEAAGEFMRGLDAAFGPPPPCECGDGDQAVRP